MHRKWHAASCMTPLAILKPNASSCLVAANPFYVKDIHLLPSSYEVTDINAGDHIQPLQQRLGSLPPELAAAVSQGNSLLDQLASVAAQSGGPVSIADPL